PDRTRALRLDRGAVRGRLGAADLRPPPPPVAGARHGPRAERRLRRRRRARVPPARACADGAFRTQARSICLASGEHVHPQRGHRLVAASPGEHAALLQRDRGRGRPRLGLAPLPVPRAGADHPVLDRDARLREVHRADRGRALVAKLRAIAVIDGEHYVPVVRAALAELPYEFVAALVAGGTEKLRGGEDYGVPLVTDIEEGVALHGPEVVVDLSDEP